MNEHFDLEERLEYLQRFGDFCMAYSTLQPGLNYFDVPDTGYIAYISNTNFIPFANDITIAFFDPVSEKGEAKKELLENFIQTFKNPLFVQVHEETAEMLHDIGYNVNHFGIETDVSVQDFKVKGDKMRAVKKGIKTGQKKGMYICELTTEMNDEERKRLFSQMKEISENWMSTKNVDDKEVRYIIRPAVYDDERFVRKFFVKNSEDLVEGFSFYDPIFSKGEIIGYTPSVARFAPVSFKGINYFTNVEVMNKFKEEGIQHLNLGLSPFYKVPEEETRGSGFLNFVFSNLFKYGEKIYNAKGLAEHKRQYRSKELPVYLASKRKVPLVQVGSGFRYCNVI
ncbi:MAG: DUF2156 domain-containing protein [Nanoarchaeota archaeon]